MAIVSQDGYLRLFDWKKDRYVCPHPLLSGVRLITALKSYYGGLLCVDWSYDGKPKKLF
jgi:hypothetical protein